MKLGNTLRESFPLLRKLLEAALDPSVIAFVSNRASDEDLGPNHIRVLQNTSAAEEKQSKSQSLSIPSPLISSTNSRVVAVVDRTADLQKAAKALVTARFSFGGNSPYAPDVVLVNEFAEKAFIVALVEEMVKFTADLNVVKAVNMERARKVGEMLETSKTNGEVEATTSTSKGTLFRVKSRNAELLRCKMSGINLLVLSVRSLDDAIDFANR